MTVCMMDSAPVGRLVSEPLETTNEAAPSWMIGLKAVQVKYIVKCIYTLYCYICILVAFWNLGQVQISTLVPHAL